MDQLKRRLADSRRALATLKEALEVSNPSLLERDGAIQRFEYSFEALWKTSQLFLQIAEGVEAKSPKSCIRSLGDCGLLSPEETVSFLSVADDRNLTVHTYIEEVAVQIFSRLPGHSRLMISVLERMEEKADGS
ncbi:MAG: nucleotidyltransferase substrate binding protein [Synergistota bacterium]|nr:nucleotidyltransferase substrate binding protein [Synergistota bacterium]